MNNQILTELGLSSEQARVYQSLLEHGAQSAVSIAKTSKVLRTHVYNICRQLSVLGLVQEDKKGKTTIFSALSPVRLLDIAASKREHLKQVERSLESALPKLMALFASTDVKPIINFYEGVEGVKKVYLDTLKEKQPILAILDTSSVQPEMRLWLKEKYLRQRVKLGIQARVLVATGDLLRDFQDLDRQSLRSTRVVPKDRFPIQHEINIYGSKLAIMMHHKEARKMVGIIIDNPYIADTFRALFELAWLAAGNKSIRSNLPAS